MKEALEKHLPPSLGHRNARGQLLAEAPFDSGSKVTFGGVLMGGFCVIRVCVGHWHVYMRF